MQGRAMQRILRKLVQDGTVTVRQLADEAVCDESTVNRWINGKTKHIPCDRVIALIDSDALPLVARQMILQGVCPDAILRAPVTEREMDHNRDGNVDEADQRESLHAALAHFTRILTELDHADFGDGRHGEDAHLRIVTEIHELINDLKTIAAQDARMVTRDARPRARALRLTP